MYLDNVLSVGSQNLTLPLDPVRDIFRVISNNISRKFGRENLTQINKTNQFCSRNASIQMGHLFMMFTYRQLRNLAGSLPPPSGPLDTFTFTNGLELLSRHCLLSLAASDASFSQISVQINTWSLVYEGSFEISKQISNEIIIQKAFNLHHPYNHLHQLTSSLRCSVDLSIFFQATNNLP